MKQKQLQVVLLYSGVAAVGILWFCVGLAMLRIGLGFFDDRPLSYLGVDPRTHLLFSFGLIVSAVLIIFFGFYLRNQFKTNGLFLVFLITGQISQIVAALAINRGATKLLHTVAAFVIVFTLPPLMSQFAKCLPLGKFRDVCHTLLRVEIVSFVIGMGLFTLTMGVAPLGEMLPALAFHVWIFTVSAYAYSKTRKL